MSSNIDPLIPPFGNPTTAGVRANFQAAADEIDALQKQIGFADYNDTATTSTPINVTASTWTKLTNNTLGVNTLRALPSGITDVWNAVSHQLALSECPVKTMLELRADLSITTTSANQLVRTSLRMAIGSPVEFSLAGGGTQFKTAGTQDFVFNMPFYIGSDNTRLNPGEIQIWSDASLTVVVRGWYIRVIKHLGD
jgi:hypothetical protein